MSEDVKRHKLESLKENSYQLRGTIAEELENELDHVSGDAAQLLKFHGSYQQDDRDRRGSGGKAYMFMVRTRIPGGRLTAAQMLAHLDLCERYGNGTLRITTRQALQLHGILKTNLKQTIRGINDALLTTLAACGDVHRNVMCCPAPYNGDPILREMQETAHRFAEHFAPRTTAYYEIWLQDENGQKMDVTPFRPVDEPIYGTRYLPRKFKTGFALPDDNCVDVLINDLAYVAIVEDGALAGYNVYVGGGAGVTPAVKTTFPAVAKKLTFVLPDQVIPLGEAIVKVQRDFGDRVNRKHARMKYLVADWGVEKFKAKVEEYYGESLPDPHPTEVTGVDDHVGWHEQGDGRWFLGLNIETGRIKDEGDLRLKTGLRAILDKFGMPLRLTALQGLILCDIAPDTREAINAMLAEHGIKQADELSLVRRFSIACPALPTCGLAVTESERVLPGLIDSLEAELKKLGLAGQRVAIHMTGCPNGCARPYSPEIGLVGKARGKYTLFLGGNAEGTRLAFKYQDMVAFEDVPSTIAPLLRYYSEERNDGEPFGDFCQRKGLEDLAAFAESS